MEPKEVKELEFLIPDDEDEYSWGAEGKIWSSVVEELEVTINSMDIEKLLGPHEIMELIDDCKAKAVKHAKKDGRWQSFWDTTFCSNFPELAVTKPDQD